jgi:hypothetical protein
LENCSRSERLRRSQRARVGYCTPMCLANSHPARSATVKLGKNLSPLLQPGFAHAPRRSDSSNCAIRRHKRHNAPTMTFNAPHEIPALRVTVTEKKLNRAIFQSHSRTNSSDAPDQ